MISTVDYMMFNDARKIEREVCSDLVEFERYANFDVPSIEQVQIREAIIEDVKRATPAALFEGTLDEWTDKIKDDFELENEELAPLPTISDYQDDEDIYPEQRKPIPANLSASEMQM